MAPEPQGLPPLSRSRSPPDAPGTAPCGAAESRSRRPTARPREEDGGMERFPSAAFSFEVTDTAAAGGDGPEGVAIVLHGFPQDRRCRDRVTSALAGGGYRVLAPDLRGYSPGARPAARSAYRNSQLAADVLALADAAGTERFRLRRPVPGTCARPLACCQRRQRAFPHRCSPVPRRDPGLQPEGPAGSAWARLLTPRKRLRAGMACPEIKTIGNDAGPEQPEPASLSTGHGSAPAYQPGWSEGV